MVHDSKRAVADHGLRAEVNRLARLLPEMPDADDALAELLASFDVYRSYLPLGADRLTDAVGRARRTRPDLDDELDRVLRRCPRSAPRCPCGSSRPPGW